MKNIDYPRVGQVFSKGKHKGLCKLCGEIKSDSRVDIQVDCFRGNDEVFNIHKKCLKEVGYKKLISALYKKEIK